VISTKTSNNIDTNAKGRGRSRFSMCDTDMDRFLLRGLFLTTHFKHMPEFLGALSTILSQFDQDELPTH